MKVAIAFAFLFVSIFTRLTAGASTRQSPIDLFGYARGTFSPFVYRGFDTPAKSVELENESHTLIVHLPPTYEVSGGGLSGTYIPLQFHLHWNQDGTGSEHAKFGEKYAGELHVVTRKQSMSLGEAIGSGKRDALAVLGFFLRESDLDNLYWKNFISAVPAVQIYENANRTLIPGDFVLSDMLYNGEDRFGDFFRYSGSLTTPPYSEIVEWTVFSEPIDISKAQMAVIRSVMAKGEPIKPNHRAVQSLSKRRVLASGIKLLGEQDRLLAKLPSSVDMTRALPVKADDRTTPESTVAIVFAIMAVVCLACMGGVIYLAYVIRSTKSL